MKMFALLSTAGYDTGSDKPTRLARQAAPQALVQNG